MNTGQLKLTRIDFIVNINVGDRKKVSTYIKVLHNIGKVKGFGPKYDKDAEEINPDPSFDLKGNSKIVNFVFSLPFLPCRCTDKE